jgi:hypothetical protein
MAPETLEGLARASPATIAMMMATPMQAASPVATSISTCAANELRIPAILTFVSSI